MSKKTVVISAVISPILIFFVVIMVSTLADMENKVYVSTSNDLFSNYIESVNVMCYTVSALENIDTCNTMNKIFLTFETTFPKISSNNTFDSQHCDRVNKNIGVFYESIYVLNKQDLTHMSNEQFRQHLTYLVLEQHSIDDSYYDVMYDYVKSTDELYLFWEQVWLNSC